MPENVEYLVSQDADFLPEFLQARVYDPSVYIGEQAEIIPLGIFNRGCKSGIDHYYLDEKEGMRYYYSNRASLYDTLPERLFHQSSGQRKETEDDVHQRFRQRREEEKVARDFFYPMDRMLQDTFLSLGICRHHSLSENRLLCFLFDTLWEEYAPILNDSQKIIYMTAVAYRQYLQGKVSAIASHLGLFTGEEIKIEEKSAFMQFHGRPEVRGGQRLGINFILDSRFSENVPVCRFIIGPIHPEKSNIFLSGSPMDSSIKLFLDSMMPMESVYSFEYKFITTPGLFRLGHSKAIPRLGYVTTIDNNTSV